MGHGCSRPAAETAQAPAQLPEPPVTSGTGIPSADSAGTVVNAATDLGPSVTNGATAQDTTTTSQEAGTKAEPSTGYGGYDDEEENDSKPRVKNQEERFANLRRCFQCLDKDKSGQIDMRELKGYLFKTGENIANIVDKADDLMKKLDMDNDNQVSQDEFVNMVDALLADMGDDDLEVWVAEVVYTASSKNVVGFGDTLGEALATIDLSPDYVERLKLCFKALDRDGSGYVEMAEFKSYLAKEGIQLDDRAEEEVVALMAKLDKNADGRVSEQEFLVTLSIIRQSLLSEAQFEELVANMQSACQGLVVHKASLVDALRDDMEPAPA